MQQRNFWLFLFLSMSILMGWFWLQTQFPPEPQKVEDLKQPVKKSPPPSPELVEKCLLAARWLQAGSGPPTGMAQAASLFIALGVGKDEMDAKRKEDVEIAASKQPKQPEAAKSETFALGGDGFYLNAVLTTHGAGVQKLTLAKFQTASWEGLPVFLKDADGKLKKDKDGKSIPEALDLIPEDTVKPSFLMYHYADPNLVNPDDARPDDTLGNQIWTFDPGASKKTSEQHVAVFTTPGPKGYEYLSIRKTYTLSNKDYHIGLKLDIEDTGKAGDRKKFRYQLAGAHGLPIEGGWYTPIFRNAIIGVVDSRNVLWRTLQDANKIAFLKGGDRVPGPGVQYAAVVTQYFASAITVSDKQEKGVEPRTILAYARPTHESAEHQCFVDDWRSKQGDVFDEVPVRLHGEKQVAIKVKMLPRAKEELKALNPKFGDQVIINLYRFVKNGKEQHVAEGFRDGTVLKPHLEDLSVRVVSEQFPTSSGDTVTHQFLLYHGPVKVSQLSYAVEKSGLVDPELVTRYADTLHLATLTDYPSVSWFGWWSDLIIYCTRFMHWLLNALYHIVPIEGITIVLMTVLVRAVMFPISRKQAQTAMRMQELAPEMKRVQEKYKNDPQARNQAVMELYRKHNVNPVGGCLPIFLQLPIFLGLYFALQESIRFRLAPFLWIENLAAPDMLFYWGQSMPWLTSPDAQGNMVYLGPYFNLLPILAVALMLASQKMMMPPAQDEQQEMQQKMMTYMMIFMGLMFYKVAGGLSLYFIATTLWGIAERKLLPKKKPADPTTTGEPVAPSKPGGPKDAPKLNPAQRRKQRAKGKKQDQPQAPDTSLKKIKDWWDEVLKQAKKK